ncbi:MAG: hypothetical protein DI632_02440 [Sphingomonas hengshuiensis]|uniref:Uncharacterized protein n=1 Tax=Sphingomonas hengshuiensis TaxID=1609977 RepID=A0A2W5BB96_9SPHN|nr:MAG: hypothetical protein DI632_02440 [Sphingomonas hengshuiensis]
MTNDTNGIDDKALSSLSVAPDGDESEAATPARGDAGRGGDQAEETDSDARLDRGLDESMDASDPPSSVQPGSDGPAPSSGYDADEEGKRTGV